MTISHRKRAYQPDEIQTVNEPGLQIECDGCMCDLTHSIRIKCADPVCEEAGDVDICPACLCAGKEFKQHRRNHVYRVIELHSYPIFEETWGADEELLLIEGISLMGFGNWRRIAEHIGTRTKEEVQQHYSQTYIKSPAWPLPSMDKQFSIQPDEFQDRKRRRISAMNATTAPLPPVAPTSAPAVHEIAGFLPGRLEFEHEVDNEAEDLVKDLEMGMCLEWGGDGIIEDDADLDVKARQRWDEEKAAAAEAALNPPDSPDIRINGRPVLSNGLGHVPNGGGKGPYPNGDAVVKQEPEKEKSLKEEDEEEETVDEAIQPPPIETMDSLKFKITMLEMYMQRVDKRLEAKAIIFDRGLLDYKKMQAADKKRPKEERELLHRLRPFARLQTAEDYEAFSADTLYESYLRKRIQELQTYRKLGLTNAADIEKYDIDLVRRLHAKATASRDHHHNSARGRASSGPDPRRSSVAASEDGPPDGSKPGAWARKPPPPLNLANSPSLHLLTAAEQTLCSTLRILPKPYLVIKETLVREYARRGGKLRRREARWGDGVVWGEEVLVEVSSVPLTCCDSGFCVCVSLIFVFALVCCCPSFSACFLFLFPLLLCWTRRTNSSLSKLYLIVFVSRHDRLLH